MSLVWHIAKKDLRRMAWPVALWCLFILASAVAFRLAGPSEVRGDADITSWLTLMRDFSWLVVGAQFVVGYVLAGALLLEDAPTGTTGFWPTRPMHGRRVAVAKMIAATLLFVAAPIVVLTPVWLVSGFGAVEFWRAAWALGSTHAAVTLFALAVAALAVDLAGFLFRTVIVAIGWVSCGYFGALLSGPVSPTVEQSRMLVAGIGLLIVALVVFAQQFFMRHNGRAWLTIAGGLVGCLILRMAWPWDLTVNLNRSGARSDDRAVPIEVKLSFSTFERNSREVPFLRVTAPWTHDGFYAPVRLWTGGKVTATDVTTGWWKAGLRTLGEEAESGPLSWQLFLNFSGASTPRIADELEVWFMRARVAGEMPVREGAALADGSSRTRIVGFARENNRLDAIYLQENEFALPAASRIQARSADSGGRYFEQFFLVDRAAHKSLPVSAGGLQSVELNSQHLGFRRLFVPGEHDWSNGVIVKVVFERDHRFWRPIEVHGVTQEDSKP